MLQEENILHLVVMHEVAYTKYKHQDFVLERIFPPSGKLFEPDVIRLDTEKYISLEKLKDEIGLTDVKVTY